jgi:urease subunit gamma/beta
MRLLPAEQDRLLLFLAAELARARRGRGLRLGQAEATALIADAVCELARDGLRYEGVVAGGYAVLSPDDVLDGVVDLVPRIEVEPLFEDGRHLVVLQDPIGATGPPDESADLEPEWLEGAAGSIQITNSGAVPAAITSHLHVFEANRLLRFDRGAAYGMRLALPARSKLFIEPGQTVEAKLIAIGGDRVVRGHGELCDGPLDEPGAREAAMARAQELGYV